VLTTGTVITREAVTVDATRVQATSALSLKLHQNVEWMERETIRRALEVSSVKRNTARLLGISPRALSYYLGKYPLLDQGRSHRAPRLPGATGASDSAGDPV
jgi:transcriptional regulator with GAF, ATPase, and Fis domain